MLIEHCKMVLAAAAGFFLMLPCSAASTSAAPPNEQPRIVFLSRSNNTYFGRSGIDMSFQLHFRKNGTYREFAQSISTELLDAGTWTQDTNGVMLLSSVPSRTIFFTQRQARRPYCAGIWQYKGITFLVDDEENLVAERDKVTSEIDDKGKSAPSHIRWLCWQPVEALESEIDVGGINYLVGLLSVAGYLPCPVPLLVLFQRVLEVPILILPLAALCAFVFIRPRTACPSCGARLHSSALKGLLTMRCRMCKSQFAVSAKHTPRIYAIMWLLTFIVILWFVLVMGTASRIFCLRWLLILSIDIMSCALLCGRLYARWLYGRIGHGIELVKIEKKTRRM
ncbi:MAG: hypothetical protein NTV22_03395 [bacterium]|nr:hypothetical protein [bacterium]